MSDYINTELIAMSMLAPPEVLIQTLEFYLARYKSDPSDGSHQRALSLACISMAVKLSTIITGDSPGKALDTFIKHLEWSKLNPENKETKN